MANQSLLTVSDAAEVLGVTPIRVRQFCQEGRLGKKVGPLWIISQQELRRFAAKPRLSGRPGHKKTK